jgi:hypothetical protein
MIILYLAVVITALYWVSRMLLPEMAKPPLPMTPLKTKSEDPAVPNELEGRIEKLEYLLAEKNKNIGLLQTELKIFHAQVYNFDKVKTLLEEEIQRLREQNRIFRSELGIPQIAPAAENKAHLFI